MRKFNIFILTNLVIAAFVTPGLTTELLESNKAKRTINLGSNMTDPIQLTGFSVPEGSHRWSDAQEATLTFPVVDGANRLVSMNLTMSALANETHVQNLQVLLNRKTIHTGVYNNMNPISLAIDIPSNITNNCEIKLIMPDLCLPRVVWSENIDGRTLAFALSQVELKYRQGEMSLLDDDAFNVKPKTELKNIDNIDVILHDVLNAKGQKLVVLDMDEFLVGRIDGTRKRVLLNPHLVEIIQSMKENNAHVIVVSQSSSEIIQACIDAALELAGHREGFWDLFDAGLSSQHAHSKIQVIDNYIVEAKINPTTVFFGDDTKEHLDTAMKAISTINLQLYHFCDQRVLDFQAIEQIQAIEGYETFDEARQVFLLQKTYFKQDLAHDQNVETFAQRAQQTYQALMATFGLTTQREAVEFLRVQYGYVETDKKHDTEILEAYWNSNGY